jgi:hypothetical protein
MASRMYNFVVSVIINVFLVSILQVMCKLCYAQATDVLVVIGLRSDVLEVRSAACFKSQC